MSAVELLLDEPDWQYIVHSDRVGSFPRTGRLRLWRDEPDRLIAVLSLRGDSPRQPGILNDDGCEIPDQIRARFPDHDIEIFAYEHGWWGDQANYFRAGWADGMQRWALVDWTVLHERLGEAIGYDEDEDTSPGGG